MAEDIFTCTQPEPEYYVFPADRNVSTISEITVEIQDAERWFHFRMDGRRHVVRESILGAFPDIREVLYASEGVPAGIDEVTGKPRFSTPAREDEVFTEPPPGCLGEMSGPKAAENPELAEIIHRAKSGYYLDLAKSETLPDRFDERGNPIPPGCLGSRKEAREAIASTDPVKARKARVSKMVQIGYDEFMRKMKGAK